MSDNHKEFLDKVMEKLQFKGAKGAFSSMDEKNYFADENRLWVHSGSPELDFNIGSFGFPVGLTEISGPSKSGKTTVALAAMLNFQRRCPYGICVIMSSEERDNEQYMNQIGIDTSRVKVIKSKFVDELFWNFQILINRIEETWKEFGLEGKPQIYAFWDSVGSTNSYSELETFKANAKIYEKNIVDNTKTEYKHAKPGDFAKSAKACMKAILSQLYEKDIVMVALNHIYDNIGDNGTSSYGGKWIEYMPTLRLVCVRKEWIRYEIDKKQQEVGQITIVKVEKNDFGGRRQTEVEILLGFGLVLSREDIEYAVQKGIIKKEGALKHTFMGEKLKWSSKREFYSNYEKHNKFLQVLHLRILQERHKDVLNDKNEKTE
jgi:RecA/RadA recombinase